jgi:hypothetical protein
VTFERTIEETFGTRDRAAIEAFCREYDIRPAWIGDRFLRAETVLRRWPSIPTPAGAASTRSSSTRTA